MSPKELANTLRHDVRRILSSFPEGRAATAAWIAEYISENRPYLATEELVRVALIWNQTARGWCDFRVNEISEAEEWSLTAAGRIKEELV